MPGQSAHKLPDHALDAARQALFAEIEQTLGTATERERARILTGSKRLFLQHADTLDSNATALFDELFMRQVSGADIDALEALSNAVAALPYAPVKLVHYLAHHEQIAVAGPVLTIAKGLDPAEVMALAKCRGQEHLLAICQREDIDADLACELINRGDQRVIDTLAKNPGAKYRIDDFGALLGRATADERARVLTHMPVEIRNAETGPAYVRCLMIDISPGGAKLQFVNRVPMPDTFILEFTNIHGARITARKIWERDNIAGLFQCPSEADSG